MKFYITGAGGFIGSALCKELTKQGHKPIPLSRDFMSWPQFEGEYGIINLAGRSIFTRFTDKSKKEIYNSRINTTNNLIKQIKKSPGKASVLVSASAVGYYGDGSDKILTENSPPGKDFLAKTSSEWEQAAEFGCKELGIRCVIIRTAYVMGKGGMLASLLPLFKLGLGAKLSGGEQYMPWISHEDIVNLYIFSAINPNCIGPINACAPEIITNKKFTQQLAKKLNRPAIFTIPQFVLKILFGELGELMLFSQRTTDKKLLDLGFNFKYKMFEEFLNSEL